jgi:hypothetical protein
MERKWWIKLDDGEALCDVFCNVVYFDSLEEAEEYVKEYELEGYEIIRQS